MSKYSKLIEYIFFSNYKEGMQSVVFEREDLVSASKSLNITLPKNLGDVLYSFRFRKELPSKIKDTAPTNCEWIIVSIGRSVYQFQLASASKIAPAENRERIKIYDATPEIVKYYASGIDEQALLTKVRYNRLIDIFTGLTCYSIQNHLRTTVSGVGQIEIDEVYLGIDKNGTHFVIPCQAKSPGDRFGIVQVIQDIAFCKERYPLLVCKPIALQFLSNTEVAVMELKVEDSEPPNLVVVDEKHYSLVSKDHISDADIQRRSFKL